MCDNINYPNKDNYQMYPCNTYPDTGARVIWSTNFMLPDFM